MVDYGSLENCWAERLRGFESLPLRKAMIIKESASHKRCWFRFWAAPTKARFRKGLDRNEIAASGRMTPDNHCFATPRRRRGGMSEHLWCDEIPEREGFLQGPLRRAERERKFTTSPNFRFSTPYGQSRWIISLISLINIFAVTKNFNTFVLEIIKNYFWALIKL